jgi:UDP-N-acetylmuramate: L-alanyl-gamma-D-glutamyl-meso-diaminopimelate ligase
LIINNLEFDHADIFDNLEEIKKQFHHLLRTLPSNGNIVFNAEDSNISDMMDLGCWSKKIGYSAKMQSEWQYILGNKHGSEFTIVDRSTSVSKCNNTKVKWSNFGEHNVKNAVSASIASSLLGVNSQQISNALNTFKGVKRRMELIAKKGGINIYDDFAHHPTEIFSTLDSLRKKVGGEQIIAVIEPRSRTMKSGFHNKNLISSLLSADFVIWFEDSELNWSIENSLGEMTDKIFIEKSIPKILTTLNRIKEQIANIVIMSNGDFSGLREIIADKID